MSLPVALQENRQNLIDRFQAPNNPPADEEERNFPTVVFQWNPRQVGIKKEPKSVAALNDLPGAAVRVLFVPRDTPLRYYAGQLRTFFDVVQIPTAFISESLQHVSQSFGVETYRVNGKDVTQLWFHLLQRNLYTEDGAEHNPQFNWMKTGVVLRIENPGQPSQAQGNRTGTSSGSSSRPTTPPSKPVVTMTCFEAPASCKDRFDRMREEESGQCLLDDPCMLVLVVIEEMHKSLDAVGWHVAGLFTEIEKETLRGAQDRAVETGRKVNFSALHDWAKNLLFLQENTEEALSTLECLSTIHRKMAGDKPNASQQATQRAIEYRKTLFESTKRRLASLESRMKNIIELSFHLVTQSDSKTMQSENQSMTTIAIMTLVFMPLSTVASVFGTGFFNAEDNSPYKIHLSRDFWILWAFAVPLTISVVIFWRFWYWLAREKLTGKLPGRGARHLYKWMKSLKDYIDSMMAECEERIARWERAAP